METEEEIIYKVDDTYLNFEDTAKALKNNLNKKEGNNFEVIKCKVTPIKVIK